MERRAISSVAEYLAAQPPPVRTMLVRVRRAIRKAIPAADEVISYGIPAFKLDGRPVIYFAGWKAHFSLYPSTPRLLAAFKHDLAPYRISKGTIRFPLSEPVPAGLIERLARFRADETVQTTAARHTSTGRRSTRRSRA